MQDKDKLEYFIKENREGFDVSEPRKEVWTGIESKLSGEESNRLWYWKAAVFLLIGAVGFLLADKFLPKSETIDSMEQLDALAASNLEKFEELEVFYSSIISKKRDKVSEELESGDMFNYLEADIKELDVIYKDLKGVFIQSQQSEEVLDRLVHLLRRKIHLLNSQLDLLERDKLPEAMRKDVSVSM